MYVAITSRLIDDVISQINLMRNKELDSMPTHALSKSQLLARRIQDKYWSDRQHLMPQIPVEWMDKSKSCALTIHWTDENAQVKKAFTSFEFDNPLLLPPKSNAYRMDFEVNLNYETDEELRAEFRKVTQRSEAEAKWAGVKEQVVAFLRKCKSLNEALKLWPHVALYIPKGDLARAEEKREKREKKVVESDAMEALKAIDTDQLVAAAVGARMI